MHSELPRDVTEVASEADDNESIEERGFIVRCLKYRETVSWVGWMCKTTHRGGFAKLFVDTVASWIVCLSVELYASLRDPHSRTYRCILNDIGIFLHLSPIFSEVNYLQGYTDKPSEMYV
jgi:hypothetical protein